MQPRFIALTFGSCIVVFAGVWAMTEPDSAPQMSVATAPAEMYPDCDAVRAAGAAPLRADQPGYRPALDANMNGLACEPIMPDAGFVGTAEPASAPNPAPVPPTPRPAIPGVPPGARPPTLEIQM